MDVLTDAHLWSADIQRLRAFGGSASSSGAGVAAEPQVRSKHHFRTDKVRGEGMPGSEGVGHSPVPRTQHLANRGPLLMYVQSASFSGVGVAAEPRARSKHHLRTDTVRGEATTGEVDTRSCYTWFSGGSGLARGRAAGAEQAQPEEGQGKRGSHGREGGYKKLLHVVFRRFRAGAWQSRRRGASTA